MRRSAFADLPALVLEIEGEERDFVDYPAIARAYAEGAANGRLNVCRLIKLAAKRYLRMLELAEDPKNEFHFSPMHVVDYCAFQEKLHHVESGMWEINQIDADGELDTRIIMEPWQIWIESAIQGFRRRITGERLVTTAIEVIPRKNAKTLRLACAAIFDICCGGQLSPQITIAASTEKQANRVFGPVTKFINLDDDLKEQYKLKVTTEKIVAPGCGEFDGIIKLTALGEKQDGLNPSLAIFEEGHAGSASVFRVVDSAFGARPNALRRMITTAGYRPEGPGWELQQEAVRILEGKVNEDFTFFAAIYTLDPEDYLDPESKTILWDKLFSDDALLEKANPMYGVGLDPERLKSDRDSARRRPDKRGEFARTRFNIWTGSGMVLVEPHQWAACRRDNLQIENFIGQRCWIGVDLAQVLDMCAIVIIFEIPDPKRPGQVILVVFAKFFLPEESPTATDPDLSDQIMAWADTAQEDPPLILTPGQLADHDRVRQEVEAYCDAFDAVVIACDPQQAHNTVKHLWDGSRPVMVYPNNAKTMTGPTDDILGRIVAEKILHDGNPVLTWNATNVHGERKGNGTILPRKEAENSKRKIDGFVALCMANGCRMQPFEAQDPKGTEREERSAYDTGARIIGAD
jgi:phage terminase large subunit-like protein